MQKSFARAIICLFIPIFLSSQPVYCAAQDPVQFITEFYTWYISAQGWRSTTKKEDLYHYIEQETLEGIKIIPDRSGYDRTDYFLKLSDAPRNMSGVSIVINPVESIGPDTLVAIVTIVSVDKSKHNFPDTVIVVVLKKIKGKLKIFKCIDTYPEA